ncbi:MAG: hypothetical protein JWL76_1993 [Thermoleophilia bacterium]|nr:hypothetical protein [Thermoleophilia bacterium]
MRTAVTAAPALASPVPASGWCPWPREPQPAEPTTLPGPEWPQVRPAHPALPFPVSLAELERRAAAADPAFRIAPRAHPSTMRNAHYANTRSQLAFALSGPYNTVEGDLRMRDGIPVMQHDDISSRDLTFEQWAILVHRAGKHLRMDFKEATALAPVEAILRRLGIPDDVLTFNVSAALPWSEGHVPVDDVVALRAQHPGSWITINLAVPDGPVYRYAACVARRLGPERLGTTVLAGFVNEPEIRRLRAAFEFVNAWNVPALKDFDIAAESARLRAIGVNGMLDLRSSGDPLENDD